MLRWACIFNKFKSCPKCWIQRNSLSVYWGRCCTSFAHIWTRIPPFMSDLNIHEKVISFIPRTIHFMNKYSGELLGNIWGLTATDSGRIYCFMGWQCFSVSEMYGKKVIMETYVRQDAELFFDIDRYLWPSDSKRFWNVHETLDLYKRVLDWIISVMNCFSFEKLEIIDDSNLRMKPELRRGAIRIENC